MTSPVDDDAWPMHQEGDAAVLVASGDIDLATAPRLRDRLQELLAGGAQRVVVDLAAVTFIDSIGLGVLVSALKRYRQENAELSLRSPSAQARKVLEWTHLASIFNVQD
jgi:anti-sigma B factor antagonist